MNLVAHTEQLGYNVQLVVVQNCNLVEGVEHHIVLEVGVERHIALEVGVEHHIALAAGVGLVGDTAVAVVAHIDFEELHKADAAAVVYIVD